MSKVQQIIILGATGSLGNQTLDILKHYPARFRLTGISAHQNAGKLKKIAKEWKCKKYCITGESDSSAPRQRRVGRNDTLVESLIDHTTDHLLVLDHGLGSLKAVLKALAMKKRVSIANKELMVVHGEEIVYLARERQAELIPLDSEHNAIFQCLRGEELSTVQRLILTASGGPFRDRKWEDLKNVTPKEVLKHPTWKMGAKTTVDSATLVNKAFEVIEAHYFFEIPYERIEVRLHPESIVHAIVEFTDGTSKMIAYPPDMRFALGYALFYPERMSKPPIECHSERTRSIVRGSRGIPFRSFSFDQDLHFEKIENGRFPCFDVVMEIAKRHAEKIAHIVDLDRQAVENFLSNKIPFTSILESLKYA